MFAIWLHSKQIMPVMLLPCKFGPGKNKEPDARSTTANRTHSFVPHPCHQHAQLTPDTTQVRLFDLRQSECTCASVCASHVPDVRPRAPASFVGCVLHAFCHFAGGRRGRRGLRGGQYTQIRQCHVRQKGRTSDLKVAVRMCSASPSSSTASGDRFAQCHPAGAVGADVEGGSQAARSSTPHWFLTGFQDTGVVVPYLAGAVRTKRADPDATD